MVLVLRACFGILGRWCVSFFACAGGCLLCFVVCLWVLFCFVWGCCFGGFCLRLGFCVFSFVVLLLCFALFGGVWLVSPLGLWVVFALFGCFLGWSFESLRFFSFDLVFFCVLAFGFAAADFLSLLRLSLAGVFGVCTFPFGSFIACLYLLGVQQ